MGIVMALVMLVCLAGCGTARKTVSLPFMISEQERSFAGALEYLRSGNEHGARELLERVVEAAPLNGITDEAIFRLALLQLRGEGGKDAARSQLLLERLASEFPRSIWARQAAPLSSYLASVKNLREKQRELKTLRDLNLSLSRDNRELRQTIERLKSLDIELEQKIKR